MITGTFQREFPRGQVLRGWDPQNPTTRTISLPVAADNAADGLIWKGQIISISADGTQWVKGASTATNSIVAVANADTLEDDVQASGSLLGLQCSGQYRFATPFFARFVAMDDTNGATAAGAFATAVKAALDTEDPQAALTTAVKNALGTYNSSSNPSGGHASASYVAGTKLTYCGANEMDIVVVRKPDGRLAYDVRSLKGFVRPARANETVIGIVAQTNSGPYKPTEGQATSNRDLKGVAIKKADGSLGNGTVGADFTAPVPTGVWPLRTTIGSSVDSSSKITNAYFLVWDSDQH